MSRDVEDKCLSQNWDGLEIRNNLKEGRGVFTKITFKKGTLVCNYGGLNLNAEYANKNLIPFEEKCDYLVELYEYTKKKTRQYFYLNSNPCEDNTFGQLLNHSSLHPNVVPKVYVTSKGELDIIFYCKRNILLGEQVVWDYGKSYSGVNSCVSSCLKCKSRFCE